MRLAGAAVVSAFSIGWRQDLDRDVTIQLRVMRPVDLAHATSANQRDNLVWAEASAGSESHGKWLGLEDAVILGGY
jgi:hypothetical protein